MSKGIFGLRVSLFLKITIALLVVLIISFALTTTLEVQDKTTFFQDKLRSEISDLSTVLNAALFNVMLNEDSEGLEVILGKVAQVEDIRQVYVLNPSAGIYMASDRELVDLDKLEPVLAAVRESQASYSETRQRPDGEPTMLGVTPIFAETACLECHDDVAQGELLGFLGIEKSAKEDVDRMQAGLWRSIIAALAAVIIIGVVIALLISRLVTRPLRQIIDGLRHDLETINSASLELSESSTKLADGAGNQASSLEEISSSLEELSSATRQNADNTRQAGSLSSDAREAAESGTNSIEKMAEAITAIKDSSDRTVSVIRTIDEIAFQTNLLALNAAVEAARAGESGKGFAVVADEVRALAQRSAEAAKDTAVLLEASRTQADAGVAAIGNVSQQFEKILERIRQVTELITSVASASGEQADGLEQIADAVSNLDGVTQQTAATSEEFTATSANLAHLAGSLDRAVLNLLTLISGEGEMDQ
jgi:methyl-accepting chemotaxis protein